MMISEYKKALKGQLLLISLAIMLLSLALPIAMLQIYDRILPNQGVGTAWVLAVGVLSAMLLEAGLRYGRAWLLNRKGMKFEAWSSVEAMNRLLTAPSADLRKLGRHGIEEGIASLKRYQDYYSGQALLALYDSPFILLFLIMIAYIGGWVVLIPLIVLLIAFFTVYLLGRQAYFYSISSDQAMEDRAPIILEAFSRVLSFKSLGMEGALNRAFDKKQRVLVSEQASLDEYIMRIQLVTQFFSQGTTVLVVMFSAHMVISGDMSSGALAACTLLAGRTMAPVGALFSFWGQIQRSETMKRKAQSILSMGDSSGISKGSNEESSTKEIHGLLGIKTSDLVLPHTDKSMSFKVEPGSLVQLPESGWLNWSPFFNALCEREYSVKGTWGYINNKGDAHKSAPLVSLVTDRVRIFQGSILDNLTLFTNERQSKAHEWSLKLGLHDRVIQLPQGYETRLGEHYGSGVDKGMEQMIGIVRALTHQPDFLLLDHADKGLDLSFQKILADQLGLLNGQLTCLVTTGSETLQNLLPKLKISGGQEK